MQDVKLNWSGADMLMALSNSNALQKLGEVPEIITDAIVSANNSFADFLLPSGVAVQEQYSQMISLKGR